MLYKIRNNNNRILKKIELINIFLQIANTLKRDFYFLIFMLKKMLGNKKYILLIIKIK